MTAQLSLMPRTRHEWPHGYGFCHCGCGGKTKLAPTSDVKRGRIAGKPYRFLYNHQGKLGIGPRNSQWRGGRAKQSTGYVMVKARKHPNANNHGYVMEHTLVAEKALGKVLDRRHEVHHVNEIRNDNRNENLVICENRSYHLILHSRMRAKKSCGNANYRRCHICGIWDDRNNLRSYKGKNDHHVECRRRVDRKRNKQRNRQRISEQRHA